MAKHGLNEQKLADASGLDRRTVRARLKNLSDDPTIYELVAALRTPPEAEQARTAKAQADAALRQLKLEEEQGLVVRKDAVEAELADMFAAFHSYHCNHQPRQMAEKLANQPPGMVIKILQAENGKFYGQIRTDYRAVFECLAEGNSLNQPDAEPVG